MRLSAAQARQLRAEGYAHLPGAVPRPLVDAALRAINIALSGGRSELCSGDPELTGISKAVDDLQGTPPINDLVLRSPLRALAENLLGRVLWEGRTNGWVVLRYPLPKRDPQKRPNFHLDGVYTRDHELPDEAPGRIRRGSVTTSTLKFVVYLSDLPARDSGNFTVIPGSHLEMSRHLKKVGWETLRDGVPKIPLGKPRQILGRAGDAVLCHYLLLHDGEQNLSPHIRYAAFFNACHERHDAQVPAALYEPFLEWPGLPGARTRAARGRSPLAPPRGVARR